MQSPEVKCEWLGRKDFASVRKMQSARVKQLKSGIGTECILLCEHPAVFTLGKRTDRVTRLRVQELGQELNVPVIEVTRGGEATFHGPGQLMIYPVLDLRARGLGVRRFVEQFSSLLVELLGGLRVESEYLEKTPGVWVIDEHQPPLKIAAVGLRIEKGVSEHGFSLNLAGDLDVFSRFSPCGQATGTVTSVSKLTGQSFNTESIERLAGEFCRLASAIF